MLMLLLTLSIVPPPARANAQDACQSLLARLDLTRPGLEQVRAAVQAGDVPLAAGHLRDYYRRRTLPVALPDRHSRPPRDAGYSTAAAERVMRREFTFVGKMATLPNRFDWNSDPLKDPEWPIELNRHGTWVTLARAYWATYDEKYAQDLTLLISDWLSANPRPSSPRQARWTWRTLECGIRLSSPWPETIFRVIDSEQFTPELLCAMLEGLWQQADYLMTFHGGGNWFVAERSGLLATAILFPEFTDAEGWQAAAWETLAEQLRRQVLPDGAQVELTPHYHSATLNSFRRALKVARLNDVSPPADYLANLERMYEYLMHVVKPDGFIPMFNDSDHGNMKGHMKDGADLFDRQDMLYVATEGARGSPPAGPSHAFRWAGQYVMRSGWTMDDVYLALDAGPYGYGHQHEDKLAVDLWAYGQELILDPGRFTYAGGKWRSYFLSTASHSTVLVDGRGQRRRQTPRARWVSREPMHNRWASTEAFDFVTGSYDDGYRGADDVAHIRKVLFVRPRYFIISDLLIPLARHAASHRATVQYQLGMPGAALDEESLAVHAIGERAGVLLKPAPPLKHTVSLHEGEQDPPAGWVAWSLHRAHKDPATLVRYNLAGDLPIQCDTVVLPFKGRQAPKIDVKRIQVTVDERPLSPEQATALQVTGDGWRDVCVISHLPDHPPLRFDDLTTDAEVAVFRFEGDELKQVSALAGPPRTHALDEEPPGVDLDKAQIEVSCEPPARLVLRYGYAAGGGFLFETPPTEETTKALLRPQGLQRDVPYVYEVLARREDAQTTLQHGRILVPQARAHDFEDGTLQGWEGNGAKLVGGAHDSEGALATQAAPTTQPTYVSAYKPYRIVASPDMQIALSWRTPLQDGGDWFYAKVTLHANDGVDWSAYFASKPSGSWQALNLTLADFRGDTQGRPELGKPMPEGTLISRVRVTLRKGKTPEPVAAHLEIDDVRIDP